AASVWWRTDVWVAVAMNITMSDETCLLPVATNRSGHPTTPSGTAFVYQNTFTCLLAQVSFRPTRPTSKPVGPTVVVVGPIGDQIFAANYGSVKVQFHWESDGQNQSDTSGWIRVSSTWAGKQCGLIHIPRIGHEVMVDFVHGEPTATYVY